MSILCKNGTFFNKSLMERIKRSNNAEVLSILQDVNNSYQLKDTMENTLLHYAARYGNEDLVQYLIDLGAAVDARNHIHRTPLFFAVDAGQEDTARLLVEANADIFMPDDCDQSPLDRAFEARPHIASALLGKITVDSLKKNIEYVNSTKFRLYCGFHHFISLKNAEITRFLLESGSPVDAKSLPTEETALHLAAKHLDLENVKLLLEFNADVNAKRYNGETPLACIPIGNDKKQSTAVAIVKVLLAAGAVLIDRVSRKIMVWSILMHGNRQIVRTVLQNGIDLKFRDADGDIVLHVLARNKNPDVLEEVQDLESASKVLCHRGSTMLHVAAEVVNLNAIRHLLNSGADIDAQDNAGTTPLSRAIGAYNPYKSTIDDHLHSVEILLEHGAHPQLDSSMFEGQQFKDKNDLLKKPVLAHLALVEASGQIIESSLHDTIQSRYAYKKMFDSMKQQLDEMKQIMIGESVTLIDFLIASDEKISLYARNRRSIITNLTKKIEEESLDSYYRRILRKKFLKLSQSIETRKKVAIVINEAFNELYYISVYAVAEKIVNYLDDKELYRILPILK